MMRYNFKHENIFIKHLHQIALEMATLPLTLKKYRFGCHACILHLAVMWRGANCAAQKKFFSGMMSHRYP